MKKTKLISIVLAALMIIGMIPFAMIPISAADETATRNAGSIEGMPTTLPNNNKVTNPKVWVDWSELGGVKEKTDGAYNGEVTADDGYLKILKKDKLTWTTKNITSTAWRGAEGIMFYVDATSTTEKVDFMVNLTAYDRIKKDGSSNGAVRLKNCATVNATTPLASGLTTTSYYYNESTNKWDAMVSGINDDGTPVDGCTHKWYSQNTAGASGWYYIPLTSFYSFGASDQAYSSDPTVGLNWVEFMERFESQVINAVCIKSNAVNLKFGDIHLVYSASEYAEGATTSLGDGYSYTFDNFDGVASYEWATPGGENEKTQFANATGLRFHVDTSELGYAKLELNIRLLQEKTTKVSFYKMNALTEADIPFSYDCFVARQGNSVAYYFENGVAKPLYLKTVDNLTNSKDVSEGGNKENDVFSALPAGYVGDIYIPLDSFWLSSDSWHGINSGHDCGDSNCTTCLHNNTPAMLTWADAMEAGIYPYKFGINNHVTGDVDTAQYTNVVVYSNFRVVYEDINVTHESVNIANDLDMKVYVNTTNGVTVDSASYKMGTITKPATVNADGEIVVSGILPQDMADTINLTIKTKKDGADFAAVQYSTSIKDYLVRNINYTQSPEEKALAADLLRYAEAARIYEGINNVSILDEDTKTLISTLGNTVAAPSGESKTVVGEKPDSGYYINSIAIRLESTLAIQINVVVPTDGSAEIKYTIDGGTQATATVDKDGYASIAVGAGDLNKAIAIELYEGEAATASQTATFALNDYFLMAFADTYEDADEEALIKALYRYCYSAEQYVASKSASN